MFGRAVEKIAQASRLLSGYKPKRYVVEKIDSKYSDKTLLEEAWKAVGNALRDVMGIGKKG